MERPRLDLETLAEAFDRLSTMMAMDPRDWSVGRRDVWLYGLFCGWECEKDHEHDDICGGSEALIEVATKHGWNDPETLARHRRYRAAIKAIQDLWGPERDE